MSDRRSFSDGVMRRRKRQGRKEKKEKRRRSQKRRERSQRERSKQIEQRRKAGQKDLERWSGRMEAEGKEVER